MGSPYDDPTGVIPVNDAHRTAGSGRRGDRDSFFDRHARAGLRRVDELDDLDPNEVATTVQKQDQEQSAQSAAAPEPDVPEADRTDEVNGHAAAGLAGRRATPQQVGQTPLSGWERFVSRFRRRRSVRTTPPTPRPTWRRWSPAGGRRPPTPGGRR